MWSWRTVERRTYNSAVAISIARQQMLGCKTLVGVELHIFNSVNTCIYPTQQTGTTEVSLNSATIPSVKKIYVAE